MLGKTLDTAGFTPTHGFPAGVKAPAGAPLSTASARRYSRALAGLKPEGSVTRGAKESRIYQAASPSVVLIITDEALGSGAVVSADGLIITNLHVVGDSKEVGVVFKPRTEGAALSKADIRRARVIRRDEVADLALVRVEHLPEGVKPLTIAGVSAVEVGSDVHAIGHPTGEAWTYTRGIVSQIRHDYAWRAEDNIPHKATVIQTQTPINPGNSGGPLIDDEGQIVGVNSFKGEGEGLNFAVSADDVKAFLARSGDRRGDAPKKQVAAGPCKAKALKQRPMTEGKGVEYLMDETCDGMGDYVLDVPEDKAKPIVAIYYAKDGKIETMTFDEDRDGYPDQTLYDTDGDGKPDLMGRYRDHEDEPYIYERMKK
jgi:S1-C subfamily serine protease